MNFLDALITCFENTNCLSFSLHCIVAQMLVPVYFANVTSALSSAQLLAGPALPGPRARSLGHREKEKENSSNTEIQKGKKVRGQTRRETGQLPSYI